MCPGMAGASWRAAPGNLVRRATTHAGVGRSRTSGVSMPQTPHLRRGSLRATRSTEVGEAACRGDTVRSYFGRTHNGTLVSRHVASPTIGQRPTRWERGLQSASEPQERNPAGGRQPDDDRSPHGTHNTRQRCTESQHEDEREEHGGDGVEEEGEGAGAPRFAPLAARGPPRAGHVDPPPRMWSFDRSQMAAEYSCAAAYMAMSTPSISTASCRGT
jgi:hypothetical protein